MPLRYLCDYIHEHKSLAKAIILSASTYSRRASLAVKHRFLVLRLRRTGKRDIWLRLERLRSRGVNIPGFIVAGGEVEANDIVSRLVNLAGRTSLKKKFSPLASKISRLGAQETKNH